MGLPRRLAITIGVPLTVALLGEVLILPGVPLDVIEHSGSSHANVSVFALGVTPIVTAYWLVEVVAFLVPRWSRLRHGNPEGRAKLEVAARCLAVALAAVQGLGLAMSLKAIANADEGAFGFSISLPLVTASLVGGVCLLFLMARLITRRGLMNGIVALLGAGIVREIVQSAAKILGARPGSPEAHSLLGTLDAGELARTALATALVALATWVAVRRVGDVPEAPPTQPASAAPYRDARALAVRPWIPIPSSSFQAYLFATGLLMLPGTLAGLRLPWLEPLVGGSTLLRGPAFVPLLVGATAVVAFLFASLMHRPSEMADLAVRLGATGDASLRAEARAALRSTLLPTLFFFVVVIVAGFVSQVGSMAVVLFVAIAADLAHAVRGASKQQDLVPVWEERRASAIPALRAALAEGGIASETRGMAFLTLWQVFAPYAPGQILVHKADAERANQTLRHLLVGEKAASESEPPLSAPAGAPGPWAPSKTAVVLGACAAGALLVWAAAFVPSPGPPLATGPRPRLEVVSVDDTIDPLGEVLGGSIPGGSGISIYEENVPVGGPRTAQSHFARVVLRAGERRQDAVARLQAWLATVRLPEGARFGFEDVTEFDPDTRKGELVGERTFVLVGAPILRTADVVDAEAISPDPEDNSGVSVSVTFSPEGARRFEDFTRRWTQRRAAILLDGQIEMAPVIKSVIAGGRIMMTLGAGDPEVKMAEATRLARGLRGR